MQQKQQQQQQQLSGQQQPEIVDLTEQDIGGQGTIFTSSPAVNGSLPVSPARPNHSALPRGSLLDAQDSRTEDMRDDKEEDAGREAIGAEEQAVGPCGDLPDKPGHLATAEQCRLANGGVCWHLLQMAVRARQIVQRSEDDSVSIYT